MTTRNLPALTLDESNLGAAMLALSPQQRIFVHAKIFGGMSGKDAAVAANYSDTGDSAKTTASRLTHMPAIQEAMTECSKQLLRAEGAACVRKLIHLREYAEDEKVQLRATTELMDRMGGLSSSSQHTLDVVHHHMTEAQQDAKIVALAKELGLDEISTRKLLIDPSKVIDAEFEEVKPELTPEEQAARDHRRKVRAMSPDQKAAHKEQQRHERSHAMKAKRRAAQERLVPMSSEGIEDLL